MSQTIINRIKGVGVVATFAVNWPGKREGNADLPPFQGSM
ncbi:hypothetical protein N624_0105 [Levilactobacillus brevis]|nr:hypothetical protein N624_0105 [Levilactobacillus brevis]